MHKLMLMTHTAWRISAAISPRFRITYRLTHWMWIHSENHKCKWKPSVYMWGNTTYFLWQKPLVYLWRKYFCTKNHFCAKNHLHIQFTQLFSLQLYKTMGETLIDLVHQYPTLRDKQNAMYKDSKYKEAKWKEITEILHLNKEDVIKEWKSLRDTYVRHKNIKFKIGEWFKSMQTEVEVLWHHVLQWYNTTKGKVCTIYLTTSYIQHTYIQ